MDDGQWVRTCSFYICFLFVSFDTQEYIRRQLEEEQRHLEMLQEQLLREQAMLLVSTSLTLTAPFSTAAARPDVSES